MTSYPYTVHSGKASLRMAGRSMHIVGHLRRRVTICDVQGRDNNALRCFEQNTLIRTDNEPNTP